MDEMRWYVGRREGGYGGEKRIERGEERRGNYRGGGGFPGFYQLLRRRTDVFLLGCIFLLACLIDDMRMGDEEMKGLSDKQNRSAATARK